MDSFANFLPMFVAFGLPTKKAEDGPTDLTEFPDEVPSEKQLKDWLNNVDPTIRRTYGALIRGDTPAHLVSTKATAERDLTGYVELPIPVGVPAAAGREMQPLAHRTGNVSTNTPNWPYDGFRGFSSCC